jgi:copper(I)-binding protein
MTSFSHFAQGRRRVVACALFLALPLLSLAFVAPAFAHALRQGSMEIIHPWVRAAAAGGNAGGFLSVTNEGAVPDRLVAVESAIAARVELHTTIDDGGIMRMRALPDGIALPPGDTASLAPGANHVMFFQLKAPLVVGSHIDAVLVFEKAGRVPVEFMVEAAAAH